MKKIKIVLVISEDALNNDKNEISNFIRNLNDVYEDYGIYIRLYSDKSVNNDELKESDLFFILVKSDLSEDASLNFEKAYNNFKKCRCPKISVYMKQTSDINSKVMDFMQYLDERLGHFYTNYENTDTIKLNITMQLELLGFKEVKVEARDGKIYLNDAEILSLENIPMIFNNKQLNSLKKEYTELEKSYWELRTKMQDEPDNDKLFQEYLNIKEKRNKIKEIIDNLEKDIINIEKSFVSVSATGLLSERQIYARRCLENGNIEEAKDTLSLEEIKEDAERALNLLQNKKDEIQIAVNELLQRAETLMLDIENPNRYDEIEKTYEEAYRIEKEGGLERKVPVLYARYLRKIKKYQKIIEILEKYINYLKGEELIIQFEIYQILGLSYLKIKKYEKAEEYYLLAETLVDKSEANKDLMIFYNNIALLYDEMKKLELAQQYSILSMEIAEKFAKRDSAFNNDLATSYNNIASLYQDVSDYKNAEKYYLLSIELRKELVKTNPEINKDLSTVYNNIATLYVDMLKYEQAKKYFLLGIEIRKELVKTYPEMLENLANTYNHLAKLYQKIEEYKLAEKYYLLSIEIREKIVKISPEISCDLLDSYRNIKELYQLIGCDDLATKYGDKELSLEE